MGELMVPMCTPVARCGAERGAWTWVTGPAPIQRQIMNGLFHASALAAELMLPKCTPAARCGAVRGAWPWVTGPPPIQRQSKNGVFHAGPLAAEPVGPDGLLPVLNFDWGDDLARPSLFFRGLLVRVQELGCVQTRSLISRRHTPPTYATRAGHNHDTRNAFRK